LESFPTIEDTNTIPEVMVKGELVITEESCIPTLKAYALIVMGMETRTEVPSMAVGLIFGSVPSVVYLIVAPGVEQDRVTILLEGYVPPIKLRVGVITEPPEDVPAVTETRQVAWNSPSAVVTTIVAEPSITPVTNPVEETVATVGVKLIHLALLLMASLGVMVATSCSVPPTAIVVVVLFKVRLVIDTSSSNGAASF